MLFVLAATGQLLLAHVELATPVMILVPAVFLVAMGHGAEADFVVYFTLRTFGMRAYSTILGTAAMVSSLGCLLQLWMDASWSEARKLSSRLS